MKKLMSAAILLIATLSLAACGGARDAAIDATPEETPSPFYGMGVAPPVPIPRRENRPTPAIIMDEVVTVAVGNSHTMVIRTDGSLWGWGSNGTGQIGIGAPDNWTEVISHPVRIMEDVVAVQVRSWDDIFHGFVGGQTMALRADGTLWGWGNGPWLLGNGAWMGSYYPIEILYDVTTFSFGHNHTMAIKEDNSLWGWGENALGEVGNGTTSRVDSPVKVMEDIIAVSAVRESTFALQEDGSLWAWGGSNYRGQFSNEMFNWRPNPDPVVIMEDISPDSDIWQSKLTWSSNDWWDWQSGITDDMVYVSMGRDFALAIKDDGSLWGWGGNSHGQLGIGIVDQGRRYRPVWIMDDVIAVWASNIDALNYNAHAFAITADGNLWGWGNNRWGQLGYGQDGQ